MNVYAVIPAKGVSTRVPRKNMRKFDGKPLVVHAIDRLKNIVDTVIVGTDCNRVAHAASEAGAKVVMRDPWVCDETVADARAMITELIYSVSGTVKDDDTIMWTHATNPLVRSYTYKAALNMYWRNLGRHDSLVSVVERRGHFWGTYGEPLTFDPTGVRHTLASQCTPLYEQDGAIFIQSAQRWRETSYFYGRTPYLFVMPSREVLDINTEADYEEALRRYIDE